MQSTTTLQDSLHLLLHTVRGAGGSDLHLSPGEMPRIRINGEMQLLRLESGVLQSGAIDGMMTDAMDGEVRTRWANGHGVDFGYSAPSGRFRVNVARTLHGTAAVLRAISSRVPTAEELGLPDVVKNLASLNSGLIFVTGASGEGKSTTLAALVDRINRMRAKHILTIEDPIEYVHAPMSSRITQREVRIHTPSFIAALEDALRQDPDVIVVGEVRTGATLQLILEAAETGHLVMGTLHTINAVNAISRALGMVETGRQQQVRSQLAEALRAVVTQRLIPTVHGGRVAAFEVLINTPAISSNIEAGTNVVDIRSSMEQGRDGMQTMEQALAALVSDARIAYPEALARSNDQRSLDQHIATPRFVPAYR